jgi:hypothetical protein
MKLDNYDRADVNQFFDNYSNIPSHASYDIVHDNGYDIGYVTPIYNVKGFKFYSNISTLCDYCVFIQAGTSPLDSVNDFRVCSNVVDYDCIAHSHYARHLHCNFCLSSSFSA